MIQNRRAYQLIHCRTRSRLLAGIRREKLYKKEVSANEPQTGKGACARPLER